MSAVDDAEDWWAAQRPARKVSVHRFLAGLNRGRPRPRSATHTTTAELPGQLSLDDMTGRES